MYTSEDQKRLLAITKELLKQAGSNANGIDPNDTIEDLRNVINYLDWKYYVQSETPVPDHEYDLLFKYLRKLEDSNPDLLTEDSPTQRVARGLSDSFPTVAHLVPMLSLDNSYNYDDLKDFDQRVKKLSRKEEVVYCVEPKFDGSSISLVYENNLLTRAATRGDGSMGDDITNNVKTLRSIPLSAEFSQYGIYEVELRGEVVIQSDFFKQMNEDRIKKGLPIFQNARNTASGALRMKDSKEVSRRGLEAIIYQISVARDKDGNDMIPSLESQSKSIEILSSLGFLTTENDVGKYSNINSVLTFCNDWEAKRDTYPYEIDGMVIKVDSYTIQDQIGSTSHHPRWAIAYKFKAKQGKSTLKRIEYQVGRTGAITPVAKIDPIPVAGVTISSVSLHNEDFIKDKDLHIGDEVIVERAGDVIPYIVGPVLEQRPENAEKIQFPQNCPSCGTALVKEKGEVAWRCVNIDCPAQAEERLIHFVSKGAMDIDGLGKDIIKRFYSEGIVKHIPDLYLLDYQRVLKLEGWKEKSVENLRKGIEKSKDSDTWRLMVGLGIRHVGSTTAKMLTRNVKDLRELKSWKLEDLIDLEDIGPIVAESVYDFFHNESNIKLLDELNELGVNTIRLEQASSSSKLHGKSFLFTGSLQKMTRDKAKELVEKNGGRLLSSVSKNLNYLIVGEKAGSKLKKAQTIESIEILDEDSFLEMVRES